MRSARNALLAAALYGLVLELMLVPAILYWPRFSEHLPAVKALMPLPFAQDMLDVIDRAGVGPYVYLQHFFKGCNILGSAAAVLFAVGAVAGEAHRGTLEIVLARPFSRRRLLVERWLAGALQVSLPVFATSATIPWLLSRVGEHMDLSTLMLCSLHQSLFLLTLYSLAFLCSAVGRQPVRIAVGVLFFTILEFSIYVIEHVTHWSLFRFADLEVFVEIQGRGALDPALAWPLAASSAALLAAALVAFERRVP